MTPEERSREYAPEEWTEDQILVYILESSEAGAHAPYPPYQFCSFTGTKWYETRLGGAAVFYAGVLGLFAFWFAFGWLCARAS
jgi:hypothetical protein